MDFAKQIEYNRRLLVEDIFRRLEAALQPLVDAVNDFFAVLFSRRLPPDWREQWHALIAEQEAAGYRVDPRSVQEFEDWIEAWARYCELLPVAETHAVSAAPAAATKQPPVAQRAALPRPTQTQIREQFFDQKLAGAQASLDAIQQLLDELGRRLDAARLDQEIDVDTDVERCEELIWRYNDSLISARAAWLRDDLSGEALARLAQLLTPRTFGLPPFTDEQQEHETTRLERQISARLGQRNVTMDRVVEGLEWTNVATTVAGIVAGGGMLVTAFKTGGKWAVVKALAVAAAAAAAEQGVEAGLRAAGASDETIRGARLAAAVIAFILLRRKNRAASATGEKPVPAKPAAAQKNATVTNPAPAETIADRGVWDLGPVVRGEIIHEQLGQNLPRSFPVVDIFEDGIVTSIKSIDLKAPSYRKFDDLLRVCKEYLDTVAAFKGGQRSKIKITGSQIRGRALTVAIPPGATAEQSEALRALTAYGQSKSVGVKIVEIER
jgi:hypothetical protein